MGVDDQDDRQTDSSRHAGAKTETKRDTCIPIKKTDRIHRHRHRHRHKPNHMPTCVNKDRTTDRRTASSRQVNTETERQKHTDTKETGGDEHAHMHTHTHTPAKSVNKDRTTATDKQATKTATQTDRQKTTARGGSSSGTRMGREAGGQPTNSPFEGLGHSVLWSPCP